MILTRDSNSTLQNSKANILEKPGPQNHQVHIVFNTQIITKPNVDQPYRFMFPKPKSKNKEEKKNQKFDILPIPEIISTNKSRMIRKKSTYKE